MSCLFEPIHGRFPTNSICDSYPDCVGCSYSDPFKQPKQTNADRIRAMSDEELAKTLSGEEIYPWCAEEEPCKYDSCTDCVLVWLKQEAGT